MVGARRVPHSQQYEQVKKQQVPACHPTHLLPPVVLVVDLQQEQEQFLPTQCHSFQRQQQSAAVVLHLARQRPRNEDEVQHKSLFSLYRNSIRCFKIVTRIRMEWDRSFHGSPKEKLFECTRENSLSKPFSLPTSTKPSTSPFNDNVSSNYYHDVVRQLDAAMLSSQYWLSASNSTMQTNLLTCPLLSVFVWISFS